MRLSDTQPQYFPRLHYFARMLAADVFVLRDEVQFVRKHKFPDGSTRVSHQAHTPIKGPAGLHLLAVSVTSGGVWPLRQTRVSYDQPWPRQHLKTISSFHATSPQRKRLLPELELLAGCRFATLAELDIATICWALGHVLGEELRIPEDLTITRINELLAVKRTVRLRRIVLGSECLGLDPDAWSNASERTLALCQRLGADEYVGGSTAVQAYLDTGLLRRNGIEVGVQSWTCPTYGQQHVARAGFIPDLSIIDLLMNVPPRQVGPMLGVSGWAQRGHRRLDSIAPG
jgi:hypothetical protein